MGVGKNRKRGKYRARDGLKEVISVAEESNLGDMVDRQTKHNLDFEELNKELYNLSGESQVQDEKMLSVDTKEDVEVTGETGTFSEDQDVGDNRKADMSSSNKTHEEEKIEVGKITNDEGFIIGNQVRSKDDTIGKGHRSFQSMTPNALTAVMPHEYGEKEGFRSERDNFGMREIAVPSSRMVINRYPGHLFIHIDQVERFMATRDDVEAVSIKVEAKAFSYETRKCKPWTNINVGEMLRIPIESIESLGFSVRFILLLHHEASGMFSRRETRKACEVLLKIDTSRIHSIHNNLLENVSRWDNYTSRNFFKGLKNFFTNGATDAWSLKTYLSFISNDELQLIPAPLPYDLKSLSKWLIVKKFSYNMWFKGFVNLRGDLGDVCTNLWKRRYVKCYGYIIFVFNEHSRNLVGTINLVDASFDPEMQNKIYSGNFLNVFVDSNSVELHFDTKDKYNTCKNALISMLPRALFYRRK